MRTQPRPGSRSSPTGLRMSTSSRLVSELWHHVQDEHGPARLRVKNQVVGVLSSDACCAYAVTEPRGSAGAAASNADSDDVDADVAESDEEVRSRWQALASESEDVKAALEESDRMRQADDEDESDRVMAGIPVAATLEAVVGLMTSPAEDGGEDIRQSDVVLLESNAMPTMPEDDDGDDDADAATGRQLEAMRRDDALAREELAASDSIDDLRVETTERYAALTNTVGLDEDVAAADVFDLLLRQHTENGGGSGERIAGGFLRAELGPSLTRLGTSAIVTPALAADRELAQIAAAASLTDSAVAWRARCRRLADVCSVAAQTAPRLSAYVAVFVMWALSRETQNALEDVSVRAAHVLFSRLAERAAFNRNDRAAEEQVELQQKMEDARARVRSAVENLSDEQREILRERRKIGRVDDVESAVGEGAAVASSSSDDHPSSMGDGEAGVVDAIDMYASE